MGGLRGFDEVPVMEVDKDRPGGHGEHLDREPGEDIEADKPYDRGLPGIGPLIRIVEKSEAASAGDKDGCGCMGDLPPFA